MLQCGYGDANSPCRTLILSKTPPQQTSHRLVLASHALCGCVYFILWVLFDSESMGLNCNVCGHDSSGENGSAALE